MADQLELTDLGYVKITWDSEEGEEGEKSRTVTHEVKWRRPRLRQYRELRNLLRDLARDTGEERARMNEITDEVTRHEDESDETHLTDAEIEERWATVQEIRDSIADYAVPWIRKADEMLAIDEHLPSDEGDWPTWLADATLPSKVISHWRSVPLAPGAKGTNQPRSSGNGQQ